MPNQVQILDLQSNEAQAHLAMAGRPLVNPDTGEMRVNRRTGQAVIELPNGLVVNSLLRRDEWEEFDRAVVMAAGPRVAIVNRLRGLNLIHPLGGLGTLVSQWNVTSQMSRAEVNMSGRTRTEADRVDFNLAGVPVPMIVKDFEINRRQLEASRRLGDGIDTTNAFEAGRVVGEEIASIVYNGAPGIVLNNNTLYGLTNHPNRNTVSGSDWGTISNILANVITMIAAAAADNYHGPFGLNVAQQQYIEMLSTYTDGSGDTALDRVLRLPQIQFVEPADQLADGTAVLFQLTMNVLDYAEALDITLVEWVSGDGMVNHFKAMAAGAPRIKSDYATQSGIVHITGI